MSNTSEQHDIAKAMETGAPFDLAEAIKRENKLRQERENDATRLQLLVARMQKSIGKRVEQRILLAACAILAAQGITYVNKERHGKMVVDFMLMLKSAIEGGYPKGEKLDLPGLGMSTGVSTGVSNGVKTDDNRG